MMIPIPEAHGKAMQERGTEIQMLLRGLNILQMEEKRHADAVLTQLGYDPEKIQNRALVVRKGHYILEVADLPEEPPKEEDILEEVQAWARG